MTVLILYRQQRSLGQGEDHRSLPESAYGPSSLPLPVPAVDSLTAGVQKEPKLDRAKQIPEWEVYDAEIDAFARRLKQGDHRTTKPHDEL
ncbi:hypothetical protein BV20DRAFT_970596 [Pilatotrama ljubarskyi]|nr:hypothetical protein BV20DRAFT_970596 [Pilatotrama ljubarskyi]